MLSNLHKDFLNLFYPPLCAACSKVLVKQEKYICLCCLYLLPKTNFHLDNGNPMEQLFWGRVNIRSAAAFYYFEEGGKCRKILHQIKYTGHKDLAFYLGRLYGRELTGSSTFAGADMIIPVPLHASRLRKRGFNQSEWFARGLAAGMEKKVYCDNLVRYVSTDTQINKSRNERWENVENTFRVRYPEKIKDKYILLVDDVITTGATIESCASLLLSKPGVSVSVLTLAYA